MQNLTSKNAPFLLAGDNVYYSDAANLIKYEVTDIFESGFEVRNTDKECPIQYQFECHSFLDLQHGWNISELAMLRIKNNWTN